MRNPNIIILFVSFDVCSPFTNYNNLHQHQSICKIHLRDKFGTRKDLSASRVDNEIDNRNLYEILEIPRDAPRSEIRKSYIKLARTLHPDANIGRDGGFSLAGRTSSSTSTSTNDSDGDDFDKVAKAWKTLSNDRERLRYDRSLRAKEFVDDVDEKMSRVSQRTASQVRPILEKFIRPFFSGATEAFTIAIAGMGNFNWKNEKKEEVNGSTNAKKVKNGFSTIRNDGTNADKIRTIEKIEELEQRTIEDTKLIQYLQEKLLQKGSKKSSSYSRVDIDQVMSSEDARQFLTSIIGSIRAPDQKYFEIDTLNTIENDYALYEEKNKELLKPVNYYKDVVMPQSIEKLEAAQMAEEEERQVMIATKEFEQSYKAEAEEIMQSLIKLRDEYKSSSNDLQNSYNKLNLLVRNNRNIDTIEVVEADYLSKKIANKSLRNQVRLYEESCEKMLSKSKAAYLAGVEASNVLMRSQEAVRYNQQEIEKARVALSDVERDYELNNTELYKISVALTRQREQVRRFLKNMQKQSLDLGEQQLIAEIKDVENRIRRMQSRANQLKSNVNF